MGHRHSIESIRYNSTSSAKIDVQISGYFCTSKGLPAPALQIKIGTRTVGCTQTITSNWSDMPEVHDARIGFIARFSTRPGLKFIRLEFQNDQGDWRPFARRLIYVSRHKTPPPQSRSKKNHQIRHKASLIKDKKTCMPLSIVMPTHNRAENLNKVVRTTQKLCGEYEFEWIIVDDGSTDHTHQTLESLALEFPNLRYISIKNSGPGHARNLGADMAKHDIILFIGDDILPTNGDFLRIHAELHAQNPSHKFAVLGKVIWPSDQTIHISSVMRHIQGTNGEQFGYADFTPNTFYDWRFFYTCNVSLKKHAVADWKTEGFSHQFPFAAFEDGELAYRLHKKLDGFRIYYAPSSSAYHLHAYSVAGFLRRQEQAGAMCHTFIKLHPETLPLFGLAGLRQAASLSSSDFSEALAGDYLSVIEGLKAWARILEHEGRLGNETWHEELLFAIFKMAYQQGYVAYSSDASTNYASAYAYILKQIKIHLSRILDTELTADPGFKATLLALG